MKVPKLLAIGAAAGAAVFVFGAITALLYRANAIGIEIRHRAEAVKAMAEPESEPEKKRTPRNRSIERKKESVLLRRIMTTLENELYDIGVDMSAERFLLLWVAAALGLPLLLVFFGISPLMAGLAAVVIAMAPILYIRIRRKKRRQKLEEQLIDAINIMCNTMKAGHSFQTSLNSIANEMEGPIADEFGRVYRETLHGMPIEESLRRMVERVGSPELEMLTTAVIIQREIGGNMSEILGNITDTLQSRMSMRKEIKTRTSSGRVSGLIVGALPIFLLVAMSLVNPDYAKPLFQSRTGLLLLGVGVVMEVIGFLVIKKIITVKY